MDYNNYFDKLQKSTCAQCSNIFDDDRHCPKKLTCFHIFCDECLPGLTVNDFIVCPLKVCEESVNRGTEVDYFTLSRAQIYQFKQNPNSAKCKGCPDGAFASYYCHDCNYLLCEQCQFAHKTNFQSRQHHVPHLDKTEDVNTIFAANLKCPEHKGSSLNYFCQSEKCRKAVCIECLAFDHKRENVCKIKDAFDDNKSHILSRVQDVTDKLKDIVESITSVEQELKNIDLLKKNIHNEIEKNFRFFMNNLEKREKSLLNSKEIVLNKRSFSLKSQLDQLELVRANFDNILQYVNSAIIMADSDMGQSHGQSSNKAIFLNMVSKLEQRLVELLNWELSLSVRATASLQFNTEIQARDFLKFVGVLGKFSDEMMGKEMRQEMESDLTAGFEDYADPAILIGHLEEDSHQTFKSLCDQEYNLGVSLNDQYPAIGRNGLFAEDKDDREFISTLQSDIAILTEKLELCSKILQDNNNEINDLKAALSRREELKASHEYISPTNLANKESYPVEQSEKVSEHFPEASYQTSMLHEESNKNEHSKERDKMQPEKEDTLPDKEQLKGDFTMVKIPREQANMSEADANGIFATHKDSFQNVEYWSNIAEKNVKKVTCLHKEIEDLKHALSEERSKSANLQHRLEERELSGISSFNSHEKILGSGELMKEVTDEISRLQTNDVEVLEIQIKAKDNVIQDLTEQLSQYQDDKVIFENEISEMRYRNEELLKGMQEKDDQIICLEGKLLKQEDKMLISEEGMKAAVNLIDWEKKDPSVANAGEIPVFDLDATDITKDGEDQFIEDSVKRPLESEFHHQLDLDNILKKQLMKELNEVQNSKAKDSDKIETVLTSDASPQDAEKCDRLMFLEEPPSLDQEDFIVINTENSSFDVIQETPLLDTTTTRTRGQLGRTGGLSRRRPPSKKFSDKDFE